MAKLYSLVVTDSAVNVRTGTSTSYRVVSVLNKGDTVLSDRVTTVANGGIWYRIKDTTNWVCGTSSAGKIKVRVSSITAIGGTTTPTPTTTSKSSKNTTKNVSVTLVNDIVTASVSGIAKESQITTKSSTDKINKQSGASSSKYANRYVMINKNNYNNKSYPSARTGSTKYNDKYRYTINLDDEISESVNVIKKNLNIPEYYSPTDIHKYYHTNFNRFNIGFPDEYLRNTVAKIFFTRPDIKLTDASGLIFQQVQNDPRDYYILRRNPTLGHLLSVTGGDNSTLSSNYFNPLLSNLAQSLEIQDDSVDTIDMGETFTGYKMQYSKHNIKSVTAGTMNIGFMETKNLDVTNLHQLWVDYQSNVYRGIFQPKRTHIWNRELDYACNIYYFLMDMDGETIKFWSKYYGCFPLNVPKSTFGYNAGSSVSFPEVSVSYNYIYKEDLSPMAIIEFNNESITGSLQAVNTYDTGKHIMGNTWVGTPFVTSDGSSSDRYSGETLRLRYRESSTPYSEKWSTQESKY